MIHNTHFLPYGVSMTRGEMLIGCKWYSIEEWASFNDEEIDSMDPVGCEAIAFWNTHRSEIFKLYFQNFGS